jgi:hypothetical protein
MKINNSDGKLNQSVLWTGSALILVAGLVASLVIINFLLMDKLTALQSAAQANYNRLTAIENFLNQQIQAAQNQTTNQQPSAETEKNK